MKCLTGGVLDHASKYRAEKICGVDDGADMVGGIDPAAVSATEAQTEIVRGRGPVESRMLTPSAPPVLGPAWPLSAVW
jgi:hypothetical protein